MADESASAFGGAERAVVPVRLDVVGASAAAAGVEGVVQQMNSLRRAILSWDGGGAVCSVYVRRAGGEEQLVVRGHSGSKSLDWIHTNVPYEFRLYADQSDGAPLAAVTVELPMLPQPKRLDLLRRSPAYTDLVTRSGVTRWANATDADQVAADPQKERHRLGRHSSVLALIPHYLCDEWLDDCIASLAAQTRPLDGIVVIDDASGYPPLRTVQRYPEVTLLHASRNVGPYRLVQQVIDETRYDAYLFQDADDWSAPDRLEKLLECGAATGAELVGTQEIRVFCDEPEVVPISWPLDVQGKFEQNPAGFPLLHPTSLVTRDLVVALGGFASGLPFSGDAEFLRRARLVSHVTNIPEYAYYRRVRQGSLTTAPATSLDSPVRKRVMEMLWERGRRNAELVAAGDEPDLQPYAVSLPVALEHVAGPTLDRGSAPRTGHRVVASVRRVDPAEEPGAPVFLLGADRSGISALACAIAEHHSFDAIAAAGWQEGETAEQFAARVRSGARRWVDGSWQCTHAIPELACLFPESLFVHVVRDVDSVVSVMTDPPLSTAGATGGTQVPARLRAKLTGDDAVEAWLAATRACMESGATLGQERLLRVSFDALIESPESVLRTCLAFAGEEYEAECLRPLRGLEARRAIPQAHGEATTPALTAARELSESLLAQPESTRAQRIRVRSFSLAVPHRGSRERVVLVTGQFPKYSETFFVAEFLGLLERSWDIHVLCNHSDRDQWPYFPELSNHLAGGERIHVIRNFDAQLAELQPDLVHFGFGTLALERTHLGQMLDCKVVVSFRGYDINYFGLDDPSCYEDVWASADALHFLSSDLWRRAQRRGCPPEKPHLVVPEAVDLRRFTPPERQSEQVGTKARPLRVVSVGRLHWKKGYEHALSALRLLHERGVDFRYRIVGDGPHRDAILFALDELELTERVDLLGARDALGVQEAMAWADVCLHAAVSEGFCDSVVEAQAMALPVVCSDADGLAENVAHEVTGYVVPRREPAALASRLSELAADPELRLRLGRAGRERAEELFDLSRKLDDLESLYELALRVPASAKSESSGGGASLELVEDELAVIYGPDDAGIPAAGPAT